MRNSRLAAPLFLLLLIGCETGEPQRVERPSESSPGSIAIEWAGPSQAALLVPVHVNGRGPYSFVLDTGATLTCVDTELAAELSLPEAAGRTGMAAGTSEVGQIRIVTMDSMRVGEARVEEMPACALDLSAPAAMGIEFEGLLGLNFLREFQVELDFERDELRLH